MIISEEEAINFLEGQIKDSKLGLPEKIFLFVSRLTPLVNVDLLIQDEKGRTLLAWRDDRFSGTGWHLPGGIVRYKEKMKERLAKVAKKEIGAAVKFETKFLAVNEMFCSHKSRGHFISFLYRGFLSYKFTPQNKGLKEKEVGYLRWHQGSPSDLIKMHQKYKKYI